MKMSMYQEIKRVSGNFVHKWRRRLSEVSMRDIVSGVSLIVFVAGIVGFVYYQQNYDDRGQATTAPAQLRFVPSSLTMTSGDTEEIEVHLSSGSHEITGLELHINSIRSDKVEIVDLVVTESALVHAINKTISPETAEVSLVPDCAETCLTFSGRGMVAKLTVRAVGSGRGEITFGGSQLTALHETVNVLGSAQPMSLRVRPK